MTAYRDVAVLVCDWCGIERNVYRDGIVSDADGWTYTSDGGSHFFPVTNWGAVLDAGNLHKCMLCNLRS